MKYEEAIDIFLEGNSQEVTRAIFSLSLYGDSEDVPRIEKWCLFWCNSDDIDIKRAAILALGDLGRIHGYVTDDVTFPMLKILEKNKELKDDIEQAYWDITNNRNKNDKETEEPGIDLDPVVNEKIENYWIECVNEYDKGNFTKAVELLEKSWELLPEPKSSYYRSCSIALDIIKICLTCFHISKAKKWSEILFSCNHERIADTGFREFIAGKVAYEGNELDKARDYFTIANEKSEGICFEDENPKYLEFFRKNEM